MPTSAITNRYGIVDAGESARGDADVLQNLGKEADPQPLIPWIAEKPESRNLDRDLIATTSLLLAAGRKLVKAASD